MARAVQTGRAIEVQNLVMRYLTLTGEEVNALAGVSFDIGEGEFLSVVGPSGCGKSTLLKILAGLLPQTSGEVLLRGTPITGPRRDIGVVFQDPVLLPWRTVFQNAMLPAEIIGLDGKAASERAKSLLRLVGLEGFEGKYPMELSGGMQQRSSITRALVHDPALLLMDEPFGALDAMTREQMNLELLRIWSEQRKTVFFITHSIPEAVFLGDRVIVMTPRPGRIAEIIEVNLPRPRDLDVMGSAEFGAMVNHIRHLFNLKGAMD
ncbi:MAG: ABC transporter ATP-binding protein [Chloroflexi bacterium]|nr:ABC transporter ATP-binding protein [Chloroflexota bacterium]